MVAQAPNPPSATASGLEARAFALEAAAFAAAVAWAIVGLVADVPWLTLLVVIVLAACGWWRPGVVGGLFIAAALLLGLPWLFFVSGYTGGDPVGIGIGLAVFVPPLLIGSLLLLATRLSHRARRLRTDA